jgi:hypothetical protein
MKIQAHSWDKKKLAKTLAGISIVMWPEGCETVRKQFVLRMEAIC